MFIFSILCYTHFYTISLLCKSYGYVIMHRYNETITSNNCCGTSYLICATYAVSKTIVSPYAQLFTVSMISNSIVCPIVKCIAFHFECYKTVVLEVNCHS